MPAKVTNFADKSDLPVSFHLPRSQRLGYPDMYRWRHLPFLKKNLDNRKIIKKMKKNKWAEALLMNDIDAFVGFDNFLLMRRIFADVKDFYEGNHLPRPFTVQYSPATSNFFAEEAKLVDKIVMSSPPEEFVKRTFYFPNMHVGIQGLYDVFEFLLKQDPEFSDLIHEDRMYVPRQVIRTITDEMVFRLRTQERKLMKFGRWFLNRRFVKCVRVRFSRRHLVRNQPIPATGVHVHAPVGREVREPEDSLGRRLRVDHQRPQRIQ